MKYLKLIMVSMLVIMVSFACDVSPTLRGGVGYFPKIKSVTAHKSDTPSSVTTVFDIGDDAYINFAANDYDGDIKTCEVSIYNKDNETSTPVEGPMELEIPKQTKSEQVYRNIGPIKVPETPGNYTLIVTLTDSRTNTNDVTNANSWYRFEVN